MTDETVSGEVRKARVFVSYSRKDMGFAERLHVALEQLGYDSMLDKTDIAAGEDWQARLSQLIQSADTIVFCVSPASAASPVCGWEVEEATRWGKRILPVVATETDPDRVPATLAKLNFIFFANHDFDSALLVLKGALDTDLVWLREHTRLGELAADWKSRASGVLRGRDLEAAEGWIASPPKNAGLATDLHRVFIAASRKAATQRQRNWIGGAAAVVVLSLGLAGWSEINRREAVAQRVEAVKQKERAEKVLTAATATASGLVFELAQEFRTVQGVPIAIIRKILDKAQGLQQQLGQSGESTPNLMRMEAAGLNELAKTLFAQGDNVAALAAARKSLGVIEALVKQQPEDLTILRDVWASQVQVGEVLHAQADLAGAIASYNASMDIAKKLLGIDPTNPTVLQDKSVTHEKIGDVLRSKGDLEGADENYRASMAIREKLSADNPGGSTLLRGVVVGGIKIGEVMQVKGDLAGALASFRTSLKSANTLVAQNPDNAEFARDVTVIQEKIGDTLLALNDLAGAFANYKANIPLREKLVAQDRGNTTLSRDLSVSYSKIAEILLQQGNLADALAYDRAAMTIREQLVAHDPNNTTWQRDLMVSHNRIGDVLQAQGDATGARTNYRAAAAIAVKFAGQDPANADWQRDVWVSHIKLAEAGEDMKASYQKALDALVAMKTKGTLSPVDERFIPMLEQAIAGLAK